MLTIGRSLPLFAVAVVATACGSASPPLPTGTPGGTPAASANATASPTVSASPSPSPSLDVTPLIPELAADGTLNLLGEDGHVSATIPASTSLQLLSPFGDAFLSASETNGQASALVALQADGAQQTLQPIASPMSFIDATGALDGHAWAWLQGTPYSSLCSSGLSSGTLQVQSSGAAAHTVAQLSSGGPSAVWSLLGWAGDNIWAVQTAGCAGTGPVTTNAYVAHEDSSTLTPVQQQLGTGCVLTSVALDGSMLCTAQDAKPSATTWRFVGANGVVRNFSAASLGPVCVGHGTLHDFEGFTMSLDAAYVSVDAGCAGSTRFDQLFVIPTATGTAQLVDTTTYLAAELVAPRRPAPLRRPEQHQSVRRVPGHPAGPRQRARHGRGHVVRRRSDLVVLRDGESGSDFGSHRDRRR